MILLLGTQNEGKLAELRELLARVRGVELLSFHERPFSLVEESGTTFFENALLKARAISRETSLPVLAEDAGLEVVSLGGAPGVLSARFSGLPVDTTRNNALLLARLAGVNDRRARFVAYAVLRLPDGREFSSEGVLSGRIGESPRGEGGFGYDPLFVPEGQALTLAELPRLEKNRISHRRRAIDGLRDALERVAHEESPAGGRVF